MVRSMLDFVELQQVKEQVVEKSEAHQKNIKSIFDKKEKVDNFQVGDWVLKWDAIRKDKGRPYNV